jgi:hypothetical protein
MKNKIHKILGLGFLLTLITLSCRKVDLPAPQVIDLGVKSQSTSIKSIGQSNNIVVAEFNTTIGAKYSVQIIPFGSDKPVKTDGFTATELVTKKVYNLSDIAKKDYDLIFMDISGNETKYPIIIK